MMIKNITFLITLLAVSFNSFAEQWQMNTDLSSLKFTTDYNSAPLKGEFDNFEISLSFNKDQLDSFALTVFVDLTSVNTKNQERDSALQGHEWFATKLFPTAVYDAKGAFYSIKHPETLISEGALTIRDNKKTVPIEFIWEVKGNEGFLHGEAQMDGNTLVNRMDFGIGTGEWADPNVISHEVSITFNIHLTKKEEN